MFIRNDGLFTQNKSSAKLFNTIEESESYFKDLMTSQLKIVNNEQAISNLSNLFIVPVEIKFVVSKVNKKEVKKLVI